MHTITLLTFCRIIIVIGDDKWIILNDFKRNDRDIIRYEELKCCCISNGTWTVTAFRFLALSRLCSLSSARLQLLPQLLFQLPVTHSRKRLSCLLAGLGSLSSLTASAPGDGLPADAETAAEGRTVVLRTLPMMAGAPVWPLWMDGVGLSTQPCLILLFSSLLTCLVTIFFNSQHAPWPSMPPWQRIVGNVVLSPQTLPKTRSCNHLISTYILEFESLHVPVYLYATIVSFLTDIFYPYLLQLCDLLWAKPGGFCSSWLTDERRPKILCSKQNICVAELEWRLRRAFDLYVWGFVLKCDGMFSL